MATVLNVIESAYRRSGVLPAGANVDSVQHGVGLDRLQSLFREMADSLFGAVTEYQLPDNTAYEATEFQRIINTYAAVITMPLVVRDDFSGEERPPLDCAVNIEVTPGGEPHVWLYESNRGEWQDTSTLTLVGYCPLTTRWEEGVKNLLAAAIADDIGNPITPFLAKRAGSARLAIASRYGSQRRPVPTEFF